MTRTLDECWRCHKTDGVENGLCDDCADHYIYCDVCRDDQHEDDLCRHIYWSEHWGGFAGAGYCEFSHDHHREPMRALLDACGFKFASWLYRALCLDRLCVAFWGPMLGPLWVENRYVDRDFRFRSLDILRDHNVDTDSWDNGGEEAEAIFWLSSLWPDVEKPRWDTVQWIREWMEQHQMPGDHK